MCVIVVLIGAVSACWCLLCLQGQYFLVDGSVPAGPGAPVSPSRSVEALGGRYLTPSQFSTLAHALRSASLAAPGAVDAEDGTYRLVPARCVVDVVERLAWGGKLPLDWMHVAPSVLWALVRSFQVQADMVDWQALCCALCVAGPASPCANGAVPGSCARAWMTPAQLSAAMSAFDRFDTDGSGHVSLENCESVQFWFEGDGVEGDVQSSTDLQQLAMASFTYPASDSGWHNVTVDHASGTAWQEAEASMLAHVSSVAQRCAEVEVRCLLCLPFCSSA